MGAVGNSSCKPGCSIPATFHARFTEMHVGRLQRAETQKTAHTYVSSRKALDGSQVVVGCRQRRDRKQARHQWVTHRTGRERESRRPVGHPSGPSNIAARATILLPIRVVLEPRKVFELRDQLIARLTHRFTGKLFCLLSPCFAPEPPQPPTCTGDH